MPKFSIIIPTYNSESFIERCLSNVFEYKGAKDEVIVVDNDSKDGTREIVKKFPAKLVICKKVGAPVARNYGVKFAKNEVLVFVDSDVMVQEGNFERLRSLMSNKDLCAVTGNYCAYTDAEGILSKFQNLYTHNNYAQIGGVRKKLLYNSFWTAFCTVRKNCFEDVGGFDESLYALEDIDFGVRLSKKGYRILLDKTIQNIHYSKFSLKKFFYNYYNKTRAWFDISMVKGSLKYEGYDNLRSKLLLFSANLFILFFVVSLFLLRYGWGVLVFPLGVLAFFCLVNYKFFVIARNTQGVSFTLLSIPLSVMAYFFIAVGILGGIKGWLVK
ncbi:MAG: glycosyltransferase [archaeon]